MPQKRILTMQDLSCVGRCSLTVALPVLSAYGIETCVLPTAILSNHTAFPRWSCLDLSEEAGRIMAAWRENGFRFDGFLTGYLGSPAAIDAARACFQGFSEEGAPIVIDPAFGDYGRLYPAFDRSYVAAMGDLIRSAHILLPNFTEVCFLSGTEYQSAAPPAYMKEAVVRLSRMTPAAIVMTGAESGGQTGELIYAGGEFTEVWTPLLPGRCCAPISSPTERMTLMLTVDNVTKKYGGFTALDGVSLTFSEGVYGLLAPNGAGKTTLIKMLTTLLFPTSGQILWDGAEIGALGARYRDILGYLPQQFGYYRNDTPRQFLRYLAALKGVPRSRTERRIDELLSLVSLPDAADKKMKKFSGGMLQRVGIAQAMINDPQLLILDEPTAGLDPRERVRFRNLIHSLAAERTVILSTHIVSDIETIAGQIVMFRDHRLYCCDSPSAVCARFQGKVFEVPAGTAVQPGQFLLSERQGEHGAVVRLLCDAPPEGGVPVTPGLEDAFLAIYREGAE